MRSLRVRIAASVIATAILLIGALAAVLYAQVSSRIRAEFDQRLVEDARVVGGLIEFEPAEGLELDFGPVLESFRRERNARTWWRLWGADGEVLAGDPDGGFEGAPAFSQPVFSDATVGGARVRVVAWRFEPVLDEEARAAAAPPQLGLSLSRDTAEVEGLLEELATVFWLVGTGTCILVGGVAAWQVTRGFAPVQKLATELEHLSPREVGRPLDPTGLPSELLPFVARLNALFERLGTALEREREFTGHVAHELRTPLTVLRTSVELAMRREPSDGPGRRRLGEMLRTILDMSTLVDNLLTLARIEGASDNIQLEPVDIPALVDELWRDLAEHAAKRRLTFDNAVSPDAVAEADAGMLRIILLNLLRNAVTYTERAGSIRVETRPGEVFSVWDSGPQLPHDQIDRVFDRLWRADQARTDANAHAGLGLSLAKTLCGLMALELSVGNEADGGLRFTVRRVDDIA